MGGAKVEKLELASALAPTNNLFQALTPGSLKNGQLRGSEHRRSDSGFPICNNKSPRISTTEVFYETTETQK